MKIGIVLCFLSLMFCSVAVAGELPAKTPGDLYVSQLTKEAEAGKRWAEYSLWEAYYKGLHGVNKNPAKADKWLGRFIKDLYVVRFEPANGFNPKNAGEYLDDIRKRTPDVHSDEDRIGVSGFFRTQKVANKLVASFLTNEPEKLRAYIENNPNLKFVSVEAMTPQAFIKYEQSIQESLEDVALPMKSESQAKDRSANLRKRFEARCEQDRTTYTQQERNEIESLYQVANKQWNSPEAQASLKKLIDKYPKANRTGCAFLYLGQMASGEEGEKYLRKAIDNFSDCWYGDGVQVGAYARLYLANYYQDHGKNAEASALYNEIRKDYPDSIDHNGHLLVDMMPK